MQIFLFMALVLVARGDAFQGFQLDNRLGTTTSLPMDQRDFGKAIPGAAAFGVLGETQVSLNANAEVFFDPATYGTEIKNFG